MSFPLARSPGKGDPGLSRAPSNSEPHALLLITLMAVGSEGSAALASGCTGGGSQDPRQQAPCSRARRSRAGPRCPGAASRQGLALGRAHPVHEALWSEPGRSGRVPFPGAATTLRAVGCGAPTWPANGGCGLLAEGEGRDGNWMTVSYYRRRPQDVVRSCRLRERHTGDWKQMDAVEMGKTHTRRRAYQVGAPR
jgi:hypothetical protein